jgi:hypothetical protein
MAMTTEEDLYLFDLRGFVVLREVLAPAVIAELNEVLDRHLTSAPGPRLKDQVFEKFLLWSPLLRDLLTHDRVLSLLHRVVDDRIRLDRYYGLRLSPGSTGVPLHGGAGHAPDPSEYYLVEDGRVRNGITTVS